MISTTSQAPAGSGAHENQAPPLADRRADHLHGQRDALLLPRDGRDHLPVLVDHEIDDRLRRVHTARTCAEARRLLKEAILASREHFHGEERSVFPLLEKSLRKETLSELGKAWIQREAA